MSALAALVAAAAIGGTALTAPAKAATTTQYNLTIVRSPGTAQITSLFGVNANGDAFGHGAVQHAWHGDNFRARGGQAAYLFPRCVTDAVRPQFVGKAV